MEHAARQARTVACEQCNAPIELAGLSASVVCRYCGHVQEVPAAIIEKLTRLEARVGEELDAAHREREAAAGWTTTAAMVQGKGRVVQSLVAVGLAVGLPGVIIGTFFGLLHLGVLEKGALEYMGPVSGAATMLGFASYIAWYMVRSRSKVRRPDAGSTTATCPQCGATTAIPIGVAVKACEHCGADLMPCEAQAGEAVRAATDAHRRARMERYRAERAGMAAYSKVGLSPDATTALVGGSFMLPLGGGTLVFTIGMITGSEPYSPAIFVMWGMTLGLAGVIAGIVLWRRRRKARICEGIGAAAKALGGERLGGLAGTVEWLNGFWAGPFDLAMLVAGPYNDSARMTVDGFAVLFDLDAVAASKHHGARALLLVACEIPGMGDGQDATLQLTPSVRALVDRVSAMGFGADMQAGGILSRADQATIKAFISRPGAIEKTVPSAARALVEMAKSLGARPVGGT